jgi:hypothetical protein
MNTISNTGTKATSVKWYSVVVSIWFQPESNAREKMKDVKNTIQPCFPCAFFQLRSPSTALAQPSFPATPQILLFLLMFGIKLQELLIRLRRQINHVRGCGMKREDDQNV